MDTLTLDQVLDAGLSDWRKLAQGLHARFRTGDFATGTRFVTAVSEAAEAANHHPDVTLTYPAVDLRLLSHDAGGLTRRDLDLAARISDIARTHGIAADPAVPTQLEVALDTAAPAALGPFWAALLTGSADNAGSQAVVDPRGQVPQLWFQDTEAHETPRQRFHLDVWVPHDVAQDRIDAAVAAGGHVVDDSQAPSYVVLADPDGNRACVCTCLGRGQAAGAVPD
jgi:4a-hydroxytetrahydrobiopterin dehydratase